jgi:cell division transport system permease protein
MRAQFVFAEIGIGLRRNLTMTIAVVISVAVSLSLAGTGLLLRFQVDTMKGVWYDKAEVMVSLCNTGDAKTVLSCSQGAVTEQQKQDIQASLNQLPAVKQVFFQSQQDAYQDFKRQFKDSPIVDSVTPDQLPASFRVKLKDPTQFAIVTSAFTGRPGVQSVNDQRQLLQPLFKLLGGFQVASVFVAIVMLLVAILLIVNTIRIAAFSRRRETGIMRLVGASSLYIQLPFLMEGAIAGLIGGVLASLALVGIKAVFIGQTLASTVRSIPFIGWDAILTTIPIVLIVGVVMSVAASFFTLRRYLKV